MTTTRRADFTTTPRIPFFAESVVRSIVDAGFEAWVVGGAVRDWFVCGCDPEAWSFKDIDIATNASTAEIEAIFGADVRFAGRHARAAGTVLVVVGRNTVVEVTTFHGGSIEADVQTRDITINAAAFEPATGRWVTHPAFAADFEAGVIRFCNGRATVENDPARVERVERFAARFGFEVEAETAAVCEWARAEGRTTRR